MDGLPGDIVALALPLDIMKIEEAGLIAPGWQVHIAAQGVHCATFHKTFLGALNYIQPVNYLWSIWKTTSPSVAQASHKDLGCHRSMS